MHFFVLNAVCKGTIQMYFVLYISAHSSLFSSMAEFCLHYQISISKLEDNISVSRWLDSGTGDD